MDAVVREADASESTDQAQDDGFAEKLAHDARAAGAERGTDSDFARTRCGAGEQKIGDVGARDKENESDSAEQNEQRSFHFADEEVTQRDHADCPTVVVIGKLFRQALGDRVELSVGLGDIDAGLDAASDAEPMPATTFQPGSEEGIVDDGNPNLATLSHLGEAKRSRHHADNRKGALVERDGGSNDIRIGAE